jgi:hypothetical protein
VRLDGDRAVGFVPRGPAAAGSYHFFSTQIVEADVFRGIEPGRAASTIGGIYDRLIAEHPGSVRGFVTTARYWHIETRDEYDRTSAAVAALEQAGSYPFSPAR